MDNERISVKEASMMLGMNQQCIRLMLRTGSLPIGKAIKNTRGTGYRYLIYRNNVLKFIESEE